MQDTLESFKEFYSYVEVMSLLEGLEASAASSSNRD